MAEVKPKPLATPDEVADWLQIDTNRLAKLRVAGNGPLFIKIGRDIRYAWADVHKWADQQRRTATDG